MTVIGLLTGGVLKGQQLITNARIMATIDQMRSYDAATVTFKDTYGFLPGDMPGAMATATGASATAR